MSYSLETLEYDKLLELVARNAQTAMGVKLVSAIRPMTDRLALDNALAAISETIYLTEERQVTWSFSGLEDPADALAVLKIRNAALEPLGLLEIARVCRNALFARSSIQPEKEAVPVLWQIIEGIPPQLRQDRKYRQKTVAQRRDRRFGLGRVGKDTPRDKCTTGPADKVARSCNAGRRDRDTG